MAEIGSCASHIVATIFVVAMLLLSGTLAQDIAPSPAIETGAASALPASGLFLCSSMLLALIADLLLQ
ncbi:hypothetical protein V6N12_031185 [Hibiscus sabdariffa]|uniref:Uncharacterized protein n=1 Tax=Hibiscus sabdariffa TaxID=183260 RepID=A0ABR2E875_9ROSI